MDGCKNVAIEGWFRVTYPICKKHKHLKATHTVYTILRQISTLVPREFIPCKKNRVPIEKVNMVFANDSNSGIHAGAFGTRWSAIASICRRPASLDLGLAFRWPISRARRQMRGDRIKCLGLRTYRTSCINATDSICRRARMESQSVVKLGQWARVDDKSNRSRSACGNATCGTFQHFRIAPNENTPLTNNHKICDNC